MCLMAKRERFSAPLQREKLEIQERILFQDLDGADGRSLRDAPEADGQGAIAHRGRR
jgi:hypothetical protein